MLRKHLSLVMPMVMVLAAAGLLSPKEAAAIPAFAKKYEVSCTLCHTVWPKLNRFGEEFAANGFQLPDTEDGGDVQKVRPDDRIALDSGLANPPISIRLTVDAFAVRETEKEGANVDSRDDVLASKSTDVTVLGGGTLNKNVSFFFSGVGRDAFQVWGQLDNVFRPGMVNLRWGLVPIAEFDAVPQERGHFGVPKPLFDMGDIDLGFKVFGKPMNQGFWYSLEWYRGGEGKRSVDSISGGDNNTALSAMLRYDMGLFSVSYRIFAKQVEAQPSGGEQTDHLGHYVSARALFKSFDLEGMFGYKTEEPDRGEQTERTAYQVTGTYFTDIANFQVSYYHKQDNNDSGYWTDRFGAVHNDLDRDGFGARIEGLVTANGRVYIGFNYEDVEDAYLEATDDYRVNELFFGMDWAF